MANTRRKKMIPVLVTAGPTREKIDPVRFISNYSTGTFGYAIAREAFRRGHDVTLVSGPTHIASPRGVRLLKIETALEMRREVLKRAKPGTLVIMAAAVCDWAPMKMAAGKIKRKSSGLSIKLKENPDILKELGQSRKNILVGFALETEDLEKNALEKLKKKQLDMVVANKLTKKNVLFGSGATDVVIIDRFGRKTVYRGRTKQELAKIILDKASNFNI